MKFSTWSKIRKLGNGTYEVTEEYRVTFLFFFESSGGVNIWRSSTGIVWFNQDGRRLNFVTEAWLEGKIRTKRLFVGE